MRYFVLTYDPRADTDPIVQDFSTSSEAFQVLEQETLDNLGAPGIEVVLFYCDSEESLRGANERYFNPEVTHRLRENREIIREAAERLTAQVAAMAPSLAG